MKSKKRCQSSGSDGDPLLKVWDSTDKGKYELLRAYYTKWNQITMVRSRIIIDTHAGSGMVYYMGGKGISDKPIKKRIYGSPLLAILKTLKLSNKLTIILNEMDKEIFTELNSYIQDFTQNGVPIFRKKGEEFKYNSLSTKRRRIRRKKDEWIYPESSDEKPPIGYEIDRIHSKAKILLINKKIEESINEIFECHLTVRQEGEKSYKPISLFLVDPCGMVGWNEVIKKIAERSNKEEGTELILNWSYETIVRTQKTDSRNSVLSTMYGIPLEEVEDQFQNITEMYQFLEKYIAQLEEYFKYVVTYGVPRERKLKPKQSKYRKYFLLICTNNKSGASLAGYKAKKIKRDLKGYEDMKKFI